MACGNHLTMFRKAFLYSQTKTSIEDIVTIYVLQQKHSDKNVCKFSDRSSGTIEF